MAPVNIVAVISPESGYYDETYEIFTKLCDKVLENERECLSFLVFHGTHGEIIISKRYASMEAYQRHHRSDYVVAALNGYRKAAEPVIKTFDIASSYGFGSPEEKISIGGSPTAKNVLPVASQTVDAMRT